MSAVKAVEAEFGFPVLSIANVRRIFDAAAKMKNPDGTPLLSHDIQQRAAAYLEGIRRLIVFNLKPKRACEPAFNTFHEQQHHIKAKALARSVL